MADRLVPGHRRCSLPTLGLADEGASPELAGGRGLAQTGSVIDRELLNPAASNGTVLLTNVAWRLENHRSRSLDGTWRAFVDPYDTGYIDILGNRNSRGYFRDFTPRSASDRVEYDFDTSLELTVPGDWNTQDPSLLYYEGTVWYRTCLLYTSPSPRDS